MQRPDFDGCHKDHAQFPAAEVDIESAEDASSTTVSLPRYPSCTVQTGREHSDVSGMVGG